MNKLRDFIKNNKKKVLISIAVIIVAGGVAGYYLYNNNKAYNSYLDVLSSYGYNNEEVFWQNNTFVKDSTLDYMQYELDTIVNETNHSISSLDNIIDIEGLEEDTEKYSTPHEELVYKNDLVKNYIDNTLSDYDMSSYLENNSLSNDNTIDYYNNSLSFITSKINTALEDTTFKQTDLTEDEKDDKKELKSELDSIKEVDLSTLNLKELNNTFNNATSIKKEVNKFEENVKDRKEAEKEEESTTSTTSSTPSYTNSYGSSTYSSNNSSTGTSSSSSSNNSSSSNKPTSYMCAYTSESSAIAAGEASGTSWDVTNCGDGSFQLSLGGGDNTGGNNGFHLE